MPSFFKKKRFWGLLLALALLGYSFKDVRGDDLKNLGQRLDMFYLILSLVFSGIMQISRALRWRIILEPGKHLTVSRAVPLYATGAAINYIMPALTGQVGRMLLFSRREGLTKTLVFSTFLLEALFDAIMLFLFIFVSSLWFVYPPEYRFFSSLVLAGAIFLVVILYLHMALHEKINQLSRRFLRDRWPGVYITLKKFSLSLSRGVVALKSSAHLFRSLLFSIVVWVSHVITIYVLFLAFGIEVPMAAAVVVMVVNTLALLVPITPGNAGTFELVVVATLSGFAVGRADAALFAIALHLIDVAPIVALSIPFMRSEKVSLSEISRDDEKEEEEMVRLVDDPRWVMESDSK